MRLSVATESTVFRRCVVQFLLIAAIFYGIGAGLLLSALLTWMINLVELERRTSASATFYNMLDIGTATGILILGKLSESVGYVKMFEYVSGIMIFFIITCVTKNFFDKRGKSDKISS